jgi:hypothetical protein
MEMGDCLAFGCADRPGAQAVEFTAFRLTPREGLHTLGSTPPALYFLPFGGQDKISA